MANAISDNNIFAKISVRIIKEQELIIGPLAWDEASKVQGIQVIDSKEGKVNLQDGDTRDIINRLIARYERIFGKLSHAVCKEAVQDLIAEMMPEEVPSSLK